jgi:hypothetical protein
MINLYSKVQILLYFVFLNTYVFSQDFSGTYVASSTSFKDDENSENNFSENAKYIITIIRNEKTKAVKRIMVKDPRSPKNVLAFSITAPLVKMPANDQRKDSYVFKNCLNENTNTKTDILLYYNKKDELNLIIVTQHKSQSFKKIIRSKG